MSFGPPPTSIASRLFLHGEIRCSQANFHYHRNRPAYSNGLAPNRLSPLFWGEIDGEREGMDGWNERLVRR